MMKRIKERKGFTLIELLIVVAIIGIIAAIAVPTLLASRGAAIDNKAQGMLRNIHSAQSAFYARNGGYTDWVTLSAAGFLDTRFVAGTFTEDGVVYTDLGIADVDPVTGYGQEFDASATLPLNIGGQVYTIDETGEIL